MARALHAIGLSVVLISGAAGAAGGQGLPDARIEAILRTHCAMCHARVPTHAMISDGVPPKNVVLETIGDLRVFARRVNDFTVASTFMPLGNETGMTDAERAALGDWIDAQR